MIYSMAKTKEDKNNPNVQYACVNIKKNLVVSLIFNFHRL